MCSSGPTWMMPALLTSTSMRPRSWATPLDGPLDLRPIAEVALDRRGLAAQRLDVGGGPLELLFVARGQDDVRALGRELRAIARPSPRDPPAMSTVVPAKSTARRARSALAATSVPSAVPIAIPSEVCNLILTPRRLRPHHVSQVEARFR